MIKFFFVDDARQENPSCHDMGPLVAIGGIHIPGDAVHQLEKDLEKLCSSTGFPANERFKWSPRRDMWMHQKLKDEKRKCFFTNVLNLIKEGGATATVIIEDKSRSRAMADSPTAEIDVLKLFLERVSWQLDTKSTGIVIVERPSGDRRDEDKFINHCLAAMESDTNYIRPECITYILSEPPRNIRLLQAADIITSCTLARIAGEENHSPHIFPIIAKILDSDMGRIGGVGLKIHPDYLYANLYHWIVQDTHFWQGNVGRPLPITSRSYSINPYKV